MRRSLVTLALFAAAPLLAAPPVPVKSRAAVPALMAPQALAALPVGAPTETIRYGEAESQFAELWLPDSGKFGDGPYPTVAVIHGGCFRKTVAGIETARPVATDLAGRGYAVWNIAYRRIDEPGGGYPGTYADIGAALDRLAADAPARKLDLARLVLLGHSAGGHLALWAATRAGLPAASPLKTASPVRARAAISVGGVGDLAAWGDFVDVNCGAGTLDALRGVKTDARSDPNADTSPAEMLPTPTALVMAHGIYDGVAFPEVGRSFVRRAQNRGQNASIALMPNAGHFEPWAPGTRAWDTVVAILAEQMGNK